MPIASPAAGSHEYDNDVSDSLSIRLRSETKDAHVAAERSGIMQALLRGTISRPNYVALLVNLAAIYRALEAELASHAEAPALAGIDLSRLRRLPAIEQDIATLAEPGAPTPAIRHATTKYVERLRYAGASSPDLLLAHAYVRYMGDLSGGQILSGIVSKSLGLPYGQGAAFYSFPDIRDPAEFKKQFRLALDAAAAVTSADAIIAEAQYGFALHAQLFAELE